MTNNVILRSQVSLYCIKGAFLWCNLYGIISNCWLANKLTEDLLTSNLDKNPVNSQHKLRHVQEWTLNKHYEMFISIRCACHNVKYTAVFCVCYWKYVPWVVISGFIWFSLNLSPWAFCSVLYLHILFFFEIKKKPKNKEISFRLIKTKVL